MNYTSRHDYVPVLPCTVGLLHNLAIVCSPLDAGQMIDIHDRLIEDFKDTELSSKINKR